MKKINLLFLATLLLVSFNSMSQKVVNAINKETYKVQAAINGVTNTVNTVNAAAATAKSIGNILNIGKGRKKKAAKDAETPKVHNAATDSAANVLLLPLFLIR